MLGADFVKGLLLRSGLIRRDWIFVVGCGHSGTTLVAAMLGAHSKIYTIPYETEAFGFRAKMQDPAQRLQSASSQCDKPAARCVCEKTPRHVYHVDQIRSVYPRAKIVIVLRDPRDVVCSLMRREWPLEMSIRRWKDDNQRALSLLERPMCFTLRYEALVSDPERTLTSLCTFLGLRYEAGMLEYWKDERNWGPAIEQRETDGAGANHITRRNWQIHQPLMQDRVGVFRRELSAAQLASVGQELGQLAGRLGYYLEGR